MIRDLAAFRVWLTICGAEVMPVVQSHDVLRVRLPGGTFIASQNKRGRQRWPKRLAELVFAYQAGEFPDLSGSISNRQPRSRLRTRFAILAQRDGRECFYCGIPVPAPGEVLEPDPSRVTIEHLVPRVHGGPNHVANCFLTHFICNLRAGSLSAPEKIKLREQMRVALK